MQAVVAACTAGPGRIRSAESRPAAERLGRDVRTLVLGGTGFVGRRLVELLHDAGNEVAVLNRGVTPVTLPPAVERLIADRTDLEAMSATVRHREWDAVFDVSGVVQIAGGASLAEHAALFDGHTARYVFVSSQSVLTEVLGVEPAYDLAAGHADTLDWLRKTGALSTSSEQADPLWGRSFDFDYEAALAAQLRPAADPRRAERTDDR